MDNKILFDCDGVLLDWGFAFDIWMEEHGYKRIPGTNHVYEAGLRFGISKEESIRLINKFNESGCVGFIPAFKDAVEYVPKLYNLNFRLEVISCLHQDNYAQKLRKNNLIHLFGNIFDNINCSLDFLKGKSEYLKKRYLGKQHYWLEDSLDHAVAGANIGLTSVVMTHPYNAEWKGLRVSSMKGFYELVTNQI